MIALLGITLEPKKPLVILRVPNVVVVDGEGAGDDDNDEPATSSGEKRPHAELTPTVRFTREIMNKGISERFLKRYGADLTNRVHLFDQTMLLCPTMMTLRYIEVLAASDAGKASGMASTQTIKIRIRAQLLDLLTKAVVELRARAAKAVISGSTWRRRSAGCQAGENVT